MRASRVLQKCFPKSLGAMHALRKQALLKSVQALVSGRRLTLIDVARSWPGAERVAAPLKAFDRLLSNRHLQEERARIYAEMGRWLLRGKRPVIVIDWSDLKPDKSWCLLRAAVPVGGRTLSLLDEVHPGSEQGSRKAERRFLQRLARLIPPGVRPILVTDAGFCTPWFRDVEALDWDWVGRLRGRTLVKPADVDDRADQWLPCRALYELATTTPQEMPLMQTNRSDPLTCRCVIYGKPPKGRKHRNRRQRKEVSASSSSRKSARREREPWLLLASPALAGLKAHHVVALYRRRMQIEESFRDLKSHRYGQAFEDSLTRKGRRIEILLLVSALATFVSWVVGLAAEALGMTTWLSPNKSLRRTYSVIRIGREALVREWSIERISLWLDELRSPPHCVLEQMVCSV